MILTAWPICLNDGVHVDHDVTCGFQREVVVTSRTCFIELCSISSSL